MGSLHAAKIVLDRHRACAAVATTAAVLSGTSALADEAGQAMRWDLGPAGAVLHVFSAQPFVLLFLTLALGNIVGRCKLGFVSLGSTADTLLVGILINLWAYLGYELKLGTGSETIGPYPSLSRFQQVIELVHDLVVPHFPPRAR